jgi:D-tyrosyl-tRNA(Tyr) deacylase
VKFVIQRVDKASVIIDDEIYSSINQGLLVLVGFKVGDNNQLFNYYVNKIINMRIFNDENKKMNLSLLDIKGSILLVSQFTLLANTKKGNRPSYIQSEDYTIAERLFDNLVNFFKNFEINVKKGRFGANMKLDFVNNGPVTILLGD